MEANGTVHAVTSRNITGGNVIYEVAATIETPQGAQQVKLATFDAELAGRAQTLTNQRASFSYEVKQKNQYTNWYLNNIAPEGQIATNNGPVATNGIPIVAQNNNEGGRPGGGGWKPRSPEETASIVKQNVLGTAHAFLGQLYQGLGPDFFEEAKAKAKEYAAELFEIAKPKTPGVPPVAPVVEAPIVPTVTTPTEVAATVPGVLVGAPAGPPASASEVAWG